MVRIFPAKFFTTSAGKSPTASAVPNRFSKNTGYDRSVIVDEDGDCLLLRGGTAMDGDCPCAGCTSERTQTPALVICRGKAPSVTSATSSSSSSSFSSSSLDEFIDLDDHNITLRNVKEFVDGGILESVGGVDQPSFLIYEQRQDGHRQVGICAALAVEDVLNGSVKRHEKVTKDAAAIARAAMQGSPRGPSFASSSSSSSVTPHAARTTDPVMIMYRQCEAVQAIVDRITAGPPTVEQSSCVRPSAPSTSSSSSSSSLSLRIAEDDDDDFEDDAGDDEEEEDVHRVWAVSDAADVAALAAAFAGSVDCLYIADGHHRTAAACRLAQHPEERGSRAAMHTKFLMGVLFPHTHMSVLPYNRCVTTLGGKSAEQFMALVEERFAITERVDLNATAAAAAATSASSSSSSSSRGGGGHGGGPMYPPSPPSPPRRLSHVRSCSGASVDSLRLQRTTDPSPTERHHISMYFQGRWLDLRPRDPVVERDGDPVSSLDTQVLFERLLRPILDIECPRTDHRMIYVCGSEGARGLEARVASGEASVAFCVPRVSVADIMRVADAGQLMPPKATCFNPKPKPGLLLRLC